MKKIGRPKDSILYSKTHKEIAVELKTSRQRVAEIEKRALAKIAAFILKEGSLLTLLLLGCSGPAFTGVEFNEQGGDTSLTGGSSSQGASGGETQTRGGTEGIGLRSGLGSGGLENGSPQAGSSGASALAGGPSMGEGGGSSEGGLEAGGASSEGGVSGKPTGPAQCLASHQTLACASVCDSNPNCQGILDCFVKSNSDLTADCPGFNDTGYSLALEAERNCCHD